MDGTKFDGLTRALAGAKTRRGALAAAVGALAIGGGLAARDEAEAVHLCKLPRMECSNDSQCCSRKCEDGACACIAAGKRCYQLGLACCSKRCHRGKCK